MKKLMGRLISLLTVTTIVFVVVTIPNENVNAHNEWHVYEGDSIQDAIDDALEGNTIYVHAGTYVENVVINKSNINLMGDGWKLVIVKAKKSDDHTFYLTADRITITGFTVTGSYACGFGGICIEGADNCKIIDNNCSKNLCAGIFLKNSNNCEIADSIVSDNDCGGIKITENSDHNIIKGNMMERNRNVGLEISKESKGNLIYNNYFNNTGEYGKWGNVVDNVPWENEWNITKIAGTNIIVGPYIGGNYYADCTGKDADGDGIGDTPYEIKNHPPPGEQPEVTNKDYLPVVAWIPEPVLSYNPTSHDFGDMDEGQTDSATFEIWNFGTGALIYSLSESCNWVEVNPNNGSSTREHDTITVSIDTTSLSPNDYTCPISIISNDGSGIFTVHATIVEEPMLSYAPCYHDFESMGKDQTDNTTFEIWNSGTGTLTYTLSEACEWVDVNPTSGTSTNEHDIITVSVDTTGLSSGIHTCSINVSSNGGNDTFTVTCDILFESEETLGFQFIIAVIGLLIAATIIVLRKKQR